MMRNWLLWLSAPTCVALFLTGALPRPAHEPARPAEPDFLPQPLDLDRPPLDPVQLLDQALARLAPERLSWLRVQIRQQMNDVGFGFLSEGTLQLAPKHCARLDLQVRTGSRSSRLLVVSDGVVLAQIIQAEDETPVVASHLLDKQAPLKMLREHGCGGPYPLLLELRDKLLTPEVQTGTWQGEPVLRIKGRLGPSQIPVGAATTIVPEFCYVTLQAHSLWPCRVEWWGRDKQQLARPLLQVEFRDPELNRELSLDECVREFSYQP